MSLRTKIYEYAVIYCCFVACSFEIPAKQVKPVIKAQPGRLCTLAGQRNRSHFRLLDNPDSRVFFAPDFVWHVAHFRNEQEWKRMMSLLRQYNPKTIISYYHSSCRTLPPEKDYTQPSKMPNEFVPPEWIVKDANGKLLTSFGMPESYLLDMRKREVRQAVISLAIARAKHYGYDGVSFDNCYFGYGVPASTAEIISEQDWTDAFMKFFEEVGKTTNKNGLKCYVNVAMRAGVIPVAFEKIAPFVDGIMTEMPFHPNIVKAGGVERELAGYEKALEQGAAVFLLQTQEEQGLKTLEYTRPLVNKYNNMYVTIPQLTYYFDYGKSKWRKDEVPPMSAWYRTPDEKPTKEN